MTALLTRAFHKLTTELSKSEQNRLAQWLLDHDNRTWLTDTIHYLTSWVYKRSWSTKFIPSGP